jgi:PadR family transcriptional regulator, regulatory protein PadR
MTHPDRALIAGVPELLLLQLLAQRPMYGYELAKAVRVVSQDVITLGESVLYPTLHVLEQRGLLRTRERKVDGRARIYYEPTAKGVKRLAALTAEWRRISLGVENVLAGAGHV